MQGEKTLSGFICPIISSIQSQNMSQDHKINYHEVLKAQVTQCDGYTIMNKRSNCWIHLRKLRNSWFKVF